MKKFLDLSSWRTALGNLLPSAHGHQGGSRIAAIGSMLIMAFAVIGCDDDDSWSPSDADNSRSSSVIPGSDPESSSIEKANSSSSDARQAGSSSAVIASSSSTIRNDNSSSSETTQSSSSITTATPCNVDGVNNCVTDSRDGKTYRTVKIGSQWWMAENLNYETDNSFCYNDSAEYCEKYGRLYTWVAAMDSAGTWSTNGKGCGYVTICSPTYPVRGVCPEGWHLPTRTEWETLFKAVGGQSVAGTKLKSTSGWNSNGNGTDAFSFSALPAGGRYNVGNYDNEGNYASFWSSTVYDSYLAYYMFLHYNYDFPRLVNYDKNLGFSVRCVKDD